ncbi:MAG TPA: hypothetical protein QGF58_06400 [Myxococcota bacterium]|nr:hypothetical protein [Myxococcota bacterium]
MLLLTLSLGCGSPQHLQYDHGRSFREATQAQTDLSRESVQEELYPLDGTEGLAIRFRAVEAAGDKESGESTLTMTED